MVVFFGCAIYIRHQRLQKISMGEAWEGCGRGVGGAREGRGRV